MYAFAWFAFVLVVLLLCGHFLLLCGELSGRSTASATRCSASPSSTLVTSRRCGRT